MCLPFSCYIQYLSVVSQENCCVGLHKVIYQWVVVDEICWLTVEPLHDSQRMQDGANSLTTELVEDSLVKDCGHDSLHCDGSVQILKHTNKQTMKQIGIRHSLTGQSDLYAP